MNENFNFLDHVLNGLFLDVVIMLALNQLKYIERPSKSSSKAHFISCFRLINIIIFKKQFYFDLF